MLARAPGACPESGAAFPGGGVAGTSPVGAENVCHQAIFTNHVCGAVATKDAEVVQVGDAIRQRAKRRGHHPGLDRVLRGAQHPDPAGVVLDYRQDVSLRALEQVGSEEVQRQDPLRLGPQELRPARPITARCWVDPGGLEDLPDCGRRYGDAEPGELAWIRR